MIKVLAYEKYGSNSDKVEEEFEFCCWDALYKWLKDFPSSNLYKCSKCKKKEKEQ